tara:strand:- start:43 stop:888 length:846 start_codon:yes stop_codon:yes gene_type:complete
MLTKWYIGVNAKSKGFFKGFNNLGWEYKHNKVACTIKTRPQPSFTAQSALAVGYESEFEAKKRIEHLITVDKAKVGILKTNIKIMQKAKRNWDSMSLSEKVNICNVTGIRPYTEDIHRRTHLHCKRYINLTSLGGIPSRNSSEDVDVINNISKNGQLANRIEVLESNILGVERRIQWIKDNLKVREVEMEFKFKESARRRITWEGRSDRATNYSFCNCCGGAIPSIPQLRIYCKYSYNRNDCIICAICMGKLAEEAKIQLGKVSDGIMDNYTANRFLRDMD